MKGSCQFDSEPVLRQLVFSNRTANCRRTEPSLFAYSTVEEDKVTQLACSKYDPCVMRVSATSKTAYIWGQWGLKSLSVLEDSHRLKAPSSPPLGGVQRMF